jgi:hypothetical protein
MIERTVWCGCSTERNARVDPSLQQSIRKELKEIRKVFASSCGVRAFESKTLPDLTLPIGSDEADLDVEGVECTLEST